MDDQLIGAAVLAVFTAGPLAWRAWYDRTTARGMIVRIRIELALRRALGGDAFVSIDVAASSAWRRGRVVLRTPAGWEGLIKNAWDEIVAALPADYDLLITPAA